MMQVEAAAVARAHDLAHEAADDERQQQARDRADDERHQGDAEEEQVRAQVAEEPVPGHPRQARQPAFGPRVGVLGPTVGAARPGPSPGAAAEG